MKKLSKDETKKKVQEFFSNIKDKNPKEVKKIKKLVMRNNTSFKDLRKKFCKKCFTPYKNPKIRIKRGIKLITCENCGHVGRWKIKK